MLLLSDKKRIIVLIISLLFLSKMFSLQLGNGNNENQLSPIKIMDKAHQVSASLDYTMVVKEDKTLWATGNNKYGQFGKSEYSETDSFVYIMEGVKYVETATAYSLIIKDDSTLWISGLYPCKITARDIIWEPTNGYLKIDDNVIMVSAEGRTILYLKSDGSLWGLGDNDFGQLGLGNSVGIIKPKVLQKNVCDCYVEDCCSFFIDNKNDLYVTGSDTYFLDSNKKEIETNTFKKICSDVKSISTGLILKTNGDLYSYGYGCYGALGIGKEGSSKEPLIFIMHGVAATASSQEHSLIILKNGNLLSCGGGSHCNFGTIGDGTTKPSYSFVKIMENVKSASVGDYFSMVIKKDGSLWAFGINNNQEDGLGL